MNDESEFAHGLSAARAVNAAGESGDAIGRFVGPAALLPEETWSDQAEDFAAELDADAEAIRRTVESESCIGAEIIDAQESGWRCWCGRTNPNETTWCSHEEVGD